MGYQESYVTTHSEKDFSGLCEYIKSIGKDVYAKYGAMPVEIITLKNGRKYLYFVGDRYLQRNKARILGYISDDNNFNSESRKLNMWKWLDKILIIFTEDINPEGIWEDAGKPVTAKHEKFEL
ncbi:MAG: hypothetical protein SO445_03895 [Lachnospiraceae bacterium]|nr:hypothetical protein [Lachnospiraceae bacterium]MDY4616838.1 hypothetical protein [Lachnospiraceae bacterium]